jgi:hypothetical protein
MTWFTYKGSGLNPSTYYAPTRRRIVFPAITENLKQGDWIHLSTSELNLGKTYSIVNNQIVQSFDEDSYLVVYEQGTTNTPTYSYIDSDSNLYFKSLTDVNSGSQPTGAYYIYYHADNIQYIEFNGSDYIKTENPGGLNYIAKTTGNGDEVIDYYSNVVYGDSTNERIAAVGYFSPNGSWQNQETSEVGSKVLGTFNGPKLRIFGTKGPNAGKVRVKIIKTSITTTGQKIIKTETIDLYNSVQVNDTIIYSIDIKAEGLLTEYNDLYGSFNFEIELLQEKNVSSSGTSLKVTKYSFGKNYNLSFFNEEIYENISFISTGSIR